MNYSIDAEIISERLEQNLPIKILKGNNLNLFTSIPLKNGEIFPFQENEENMFISYYYGDFHYKINVQFSKKDKMKQVDVYKFIINEIFIEKNNRKNPRENVEVDALILDSKNMYYATILDISASGARFQTENPIEKNKIEAHFPNKEGKPNKRKGKVVWSKKGEESYYYGIKFSN